MSARRIVIAWWDRLMTRWFSPPRWLRWGVGLIVGLGLFYWGWCWGLWGRDNLLLQYLFQCTCPAISEEARYPAQVDVLAPACSDPGLGAVSSSGRYMYIGLNRPSYSQYLVDDKTGERVPVDIPGRAGFLTDEVALGIECDPCQYHLYDVNGTKLLRLNFVAIPRNQPFDLAALEGLRAAEKVFVVLKTQGDALAVALASDYLHHPEANFVLGAERGNIASIKEIVKILEENGIKFEHAEVSLDEILRSGLVSHSGMLRWSLRPRPGIYSTANSTLLVESYRLSQLGDPFYAQAWTYQDQGVVLELGPDVYLTTGTSRGFFPIQLFRVLQPILLLKAPKEYLTPEAQQAVEAREANELTAKVSAAVIFLIAAGIIAAAVVSGMVWQRSKSKGMKSSQG